MMKKTVTFGEVMLRLATPGYERFGQGNTLNATYGGGEANVAVSLANFGLPVSYVTRLPDNDIARACLRELRGFGVDVNDVVFGGDRMGIYFLETGSVSRGSKVIYDRSGSSIAMIEPGMIDWDAVLADAGWFHWTGITPAISEGAAQVCLEALKKCNSKGIPVSCDLNYRKNLWKWGKKAHEVMPELVSCTDIVLGNEEDASMALGIKPDGVDVRAGVVDADAYLSVSRQIMEQYPRCRKVITTLRGSINANDNTWAGVLYDGRNLLKTRQYRITHIVDRVGGGDSFMGGLIYGLRVYGDDQKALDFAVAASCLKHTVYGDYNRVTVQEVEKLMSGDASGRVAR
ncbi:MAG: sugar kinase [Bacteroidaceae bacterium]|nr:sugar kinase [Bacteroidaceae bacterium]